jgi:hypothetical protein
VGHLLGAVTLCRFPCARTDRQSAPVFDEYGDSRLMQTSSRGCPGREPTVGSGPVPTIGEIAGRSARPTVGRAWLRRRDLATVAEVDPPAPVGSRPSPSAPGRPASWSRRCHPRRCPHPMPLWQGTRVGASHERRFPCRGAALLALLAPCPLCGTRGPPSLVAPGRGAHHPNGRFGPRTRPPPRTEQAAPGAPCGRRPGGGLRSPGCMGLPDYGVARCLLSPGVIRRR